MRYKDIISEALLPNGNEPGEFDYAIQRRPKNKPENNGKILNDVLDNAPILSKNLRVSFPSIDYGDHFDRNKFSKSFANLSEKIVSILNEIINGNDVVISPLEEYKNIYVDIKRKQQRPQKKGLLSVLIGKIQIQKDEISPENILLQLNNIIAEIRKLNASIDDVFTCFDFAKEQLTALRTELELKSKSGAFPKNAIIKINKLISYIKKAEYLIIKTLDAVQLEIKYLAKKKNKNQSSLGSNLTI